MSSLTETEHTRLQFQIDRIAFFSDAVIAIALTLMVLEIKIPEMGEKTSFQQVLNQYGVTLTLHILALLVGFLTIGNLWIQHHALFEHIINYNNALVRINLYFLLTVMLLPISISFFFTGNEPHQMQRVVYFMNLFLCSFTYSLMLLVIFNKKNHFYNIRDKQKIRDIKNNSYLGTIVFFIVVVLVSFDVSAFYLAFLLIPVYEIIRRRKRKKLQAKKAIANKE
ncbi:MAG TPA: TMEM175 family protein [Chitinophagaceae bacterium]